MIPMSTKELKYIAFLIENDKKNPEIKFSLLNRINDTLDQNIRTGTY